jgi:hypothetical protein
MHNSAFSNNAAGALLASFLTRDASSYRDTTSSNADDLPADEDFTERTARKHLFWLLLKGGLTFGLSLALLTVITLVVVLLTVVTLVVWQNV